MSFAIIIIVSIFLLILFGAFVYFYYKSKKELDLLKEILDNIENPFKELKKQYKVCKIYKKAINMNNSTLPNKLLANIIQKKADSNLKEDENQKELGKILNPSKVNDKEEIKDENENENLNTKKGRKNELKEATLTEAYSEMTSTKRTTTPPLNYKRKISLLGDTGSSNDGDKNLFLDNEIRDYDPIDVEKLPIPVMKICISGGPSAGKSTLISECSGKPLPNLAKSVIVPDAYSILIKGGVEKKSLDYERLNKLPFYYHQIMLELQIKLEKSFLHLAKLNKKEQTILICERGRMEIYGYLPNKKVNELLKDLHLSKEDLREKAYDLAIILSTTRTTTKTKTTDEDPKDLDFLKAKTDIKSSDSDTKKPLRFDKRLIKAWKGHPIIFLLDNKQPIDEKIKKGFEIIVKCINFSDVPKKRYKFELSSFDEKEVFSESHIDGYDEYKVEIRYLLSKNSKETESKIKWKSSSNGNSYIHIVKKLGNPVSKKKYRISGKEYFTFSDFQDKSKPIISYKEICFIIYPNTFIIQILPFTIPDLLILKIESENLDPPPIPKFMQLKADTNLSDDKSYKVKNLALKINQELVEKKESKRESPTQKEILNVILDSKIKEEIIPRNESESETLQPQEINKEIIEHKINEKLKSQ